MIEHTKKLAFLDERISNVKIMMKGEIVLLPGEQKGETVDNWKQRTCDREENIVFVFGILVFALIFLQFGWPKARLKLSRSQV